MILLFYMKQRREGKVFYIFIVQDYHDQVTVILKTKNHLFLDNHVECLVNT